MKAREHEKGRMVSMMPEPWNFVSNDEHFVKSDPSYKDDERPRICIDKYSWDQVI